jgi:hypothetical protein
MSRWTGIKAKAFAVSRRWAITKAARAQAMKSKTPSTLREALRQPENVAARLSVPERLLLFCIASHTDWQKAGTGTTVTAMMVRGLIERNAVREPNFLPPNPTNLSC